LQTAVPTFVFFKNGRQLTEDTVKGANPKAVEAAIEKLAGKAQPNYVEAGTSPADKALQGHVSPSHAVLAALVPCS
jgi:thioredoxin-like negative regulator of GroEL